MAKKKPAPTFQARTDNQRHLVSQLKDRQLVFAVGPAGCGKTFIAANYAAAQLLSGQINKIIVTRPMVTADEDMGFLPGEAGDKFSPFFAPVREIFEETLGRSDTTNLVRTGKIDIAPLAFLRGHTFKDAFVILDEAQNITPGQMKLFLTRIGVGAQVCICGDPEQRDIDGPCGLMDAVQRFENLDEVGVTHLDHSDVMRSALVKKILEGYQSKSQSIIPLKRQV